MAPESTGVVIADPSNLDRLQALFDEIDRETGNVAAGSIERSRDRYDFLASDGFWVLIGTVGGEFAGYATAVRIPKLDERIGVLYIAEVHVLQRHRRKGVASGMLQEALALASERGLWRIRLNADPKDEGVRRFYESQGFRDGGDGFYQRNVGS
ncbi:MAG: GNAT family N-acetyltransferase [Planctomycetota bacterium]|jgi:aminoglycoside 3-N-acetyltransferase I